MDKILKFFEDYGLPGWLVPTIALLAVLAFVVPWGLVGDMLRSLIYLGPIFLVILLAVLIAEEWMGYVQTKRFFETPYVVLEVRLPAEITQSPVAMETALNSFYYTGEPATPYEKYVQGRIRPQFSLEIASLEGEVHFYIHTRAGLRNIIEAQLYSQYPGIEIVEVPDYVNRIQFDRTKMNLFGIEQTLQKPDPYPIKTYIDYGLHDQTKEEFKIDPLNGILEFFGSFGKGEYGFFQLIIRSHDPASDFIDSGQKLIKELNDKALEKPAGSTMPIFKPLSKDMQNKIEIITRNIGKKPFDAGIRILYLADNEHYNRDRQGGLPTMMRSFESHESNGFKPVFYTYKYKWQDPGGKKAEANKKDLFNAYRWRSYLNSPYTRPSFVLSSEEIATVWHLPGQVAKTPTLSRITSRRAEAPSNLPQG